MPMQYEIVGAVVHGRSTGTLTDAELLDVARRVAADPARPGTTAELWDLSDSSKLEVTSKGIRDLVALDKEHSEALEGGRIAIVAPSDVAFGIARIYQTLSQDGPLEVEVFRERDDAERWLEAH